MRTMVAVYEILRDTLDPDPAATSPYLNVSCSDETTTIIIKLLNVYFVEDCAALSHPSSERVIFIALGCSYQRHHNDYDSQ